MADSAINVPRELLDRYATSAPRYTSYPTAIDWKDDVDVADYPSILKEAAGTEGPCSVYVHIPFCDERCLFCGCNVVISRDHSRADHYLTHLEREFEAVGETGIGKRPVTQYHWGGGTPTYLSVDQIRRLQVAFNKVFHLAPDAEVAIEVDPRTTSAEQLQVLGESGFNRLSLGIQDFDPRVQKAIKRVQSLEETRAVVDAGRAAGFGSVSVDLIYGLPHQTQDSFAETVKIVLSEIRPERIALFHLAHVPWLKKHHRAMEMDAAPSPDQKMDIFTRTVETCAAAGYEYLGLDHFALPDDELARARKEGTLQRNFMGYGTRAGCDLIGFGVSSIGEVSGRFFQNEKVLADWNSSVERCGFGVQRGHLLSAEDHLRRDIIMTLMCQGAISKSDVEKKHSIRFDETFAEELGELKPLEKDGLLKISPEALTLTPLGQIFMRNVAVVFDRYFRERRMRGDMNEKTFSRTL